MGRHATRSCLVWLFLNLVVSVSADPPATQVGPAKGALVVVGGGRLTGTRIVERFIELAGGATARIALVPTAGTARSYSTSWPVWRMFRDAGATNLVILHTRDRREADSESFVAPLMTVKGVWFGGGRQWRLVDSYLDTRTERAFRAVLERGGVIGGSSAGATIQGEYLVRGARESNRIMMAPDYEEGFGYLKRCAIDQHLIARKREDDLVDVVRTHPELLGIGIDEGTAIVVRGDRFEVIGKSKVAIYDPLRPKPDSGSMYYFLDSGERFDLRSRVRLAATGHVKEGAPDE